MEDEPDFDADDAAMTQDGAVRPKEVAFPLMADVQEIELGGLSKGWYIVCGEAVRSEVVLEKDCMWARIFDIEESNGGGMGENLIEQRIFNNSGFTYIPVMHISIILVIAIVSAALVVGLAYGIYAKVHSDRRKRLDK